LYWRKIGENVI